MPLTEAQEPKYSTDVRGRLFNRESGEVIPDDEPVFIFRARDIHAAEGLARYAVTCNDESHRNTILTRWKHFMDFKKKYQNRMKEPDS